MKPQDILFFVTLAFLLVKREPRYFVFVGLACLTVSIPLFSYWIFFTAERLTWYSAFCFLTAVLFSLQQSRKVQ